MNPFKSTNHNVIMEYIENNLMNKELYVENPIAGVKNSVYRGTLINAMYRDNDWKYDSNDELTRRVDKKYVDPEKVEGIEYMCAFYGDLILKFDTLQLEIDAGGLYFQEFKPENGVRSYIIQGKKGMLRLIEKNEYTKKHIENEMWTI
jgi:hypothetical protein